MMSRPDFRHPELFVRLLEHRVVTLTRGLCTVILMGVALFLGYSNTEAADGRSNSGIVLAQFSSGGGSEHLIGAQDLVEITVFNVPELSKSLQVANTGTINFPLLGEITVAGKTARQVEQDLTTRLGVEYLQNPQVTVYVKENNSRNITISGAVRKPGVYPLETRTSLLQAIAIAGDFNESAETTVLVLRGAGRGHSAAKFDIKAIQKGQMADPTLRAGDRVVVGESAIKKGFNTILKSMPLIGAFGAF